MSKEELINKRDNLIKQMMKEKAQIDNTTNNTLDGAKTIELKNLEDKYLPLIIELNEQINK